MSSPAENGSGLPVTWFKLCIALLVCLAGGGAMPTGATYRVTGNGVARAGHMAYLHCFLEGSDTGSVTRPPSYTWVKNGTVVPGQTEMDLNLHNVTRQNAGLYQCGGPGPFTGGEGIDLHVFVPGDRLPMPQVGHIGTPVLGRPYILHCNFVEKYIPSKDTVYTWSRNAIDMTGQSDKMLNFTSVTETDAGEYTCSAREGAINTTSPPSHKYTLNPLVSPLVTIKKPSTDSAIKGILGKNITLTCQVIRASPEVPNNGYSWSYRPFHQEQLRPLIGNTSTLTLGPLTSEDSGQYICQARNDQDVKHLNLTGNASVTVDVVSDGDTFPNDTYTTKNLTTATNLETEKGNPHDDKQRVTIWVAVSAVFVIIIIIGIVVWRRTRKNRQGGKCLGGKWPCKRGRRHKKPVNGVGDEGHKLQKVDETEGLLQDGTDGNHASSDANNTEGSGSTRGEEAPENGGTPVSNEDDSSRAHIHQPLDSRKSAVEPKHVPRPESVRYRQKNKHPSEVVEEDEMTV